MSTAWFPHSFTGHVVRHDVGTYRYTVVFLPPDIAARLPLAEHPRLRINGEVNDLPFSGAWQPVRGRWYLMLSKPLLRDAGLTLGEVAEIRFRVEDQDSVDTPEPLQRALAADAAAGEAWAALSAGKRRALAHRVASARTAATAERRLREVLAALSGQSSA